MIFFLGDRRAINMYSPRKWFISRMLGVPSFCTEGKIQWLNDLQEITIHNLLQVLDLGRHSCSSMNSNSCLTVEPKLLLLYNSRTGGLDQLLENIFFKFETFIIINCRPLDPCSSSNRESSHAQAKWPNTHFHILPRWEIFILIGARAYNTFNLPLHCCNMHRSI